MIKPRNFWRQTSWQLTETSTFLVRTAYVWLRSGTLQTDFGSQKKVSLEGCVDQGPGLSKKLCIQLMFGHSDGIRPTGRRWWRRNEFTSEELTQRFHQFSKDVVNLVDRIENLQQTTSSYCEFTYIISQMVYYNYTGVEFLHIFSTISEITCCYRTHL